MVRTESVVRKEESGLKLPKNKKSKNLYSREELDEMVVRLAEAHGLV